LMENLELRHYSCTKLLREMEMAESDSNGELVNI
jgi:hypothetical protein